MIRRHPDILAIAVLVVILAAGGHFASLLPIHEAHQDVRLAMLEAQGDMLKVQDDALRGIGEARIELVKAEGDLVREAVLLRRELSKLPACPLAR
jgi:hypothetical protein